LMRGVDELALARSFHALDFRGLLSLVVGLPFICLPFWRGGRGDGPSATTQSFRSIKDVFRPRSGGDDDGEPGREWGGVKGTIVANELAWGEIGSSRMLGESGG
jgi:hypothetical protein